MLGVAYKSNKEPLVIIVSMVTNGNGKSRKDEITCVQLSKDAKRQLDTFGKKSDTYENIIQNLMDSQCVKTSQDDEEMSS